MHERLDRGDIDDAPLGGPQGLEKRMRHIEDAIKIDRDDVFPILDDGRRSASHAVAAGDAGIFDQDRGLPHLFGHFLSPPDPTFAAAPLGPNTFPLPPPNPHLLPPPPPPPPPS